MQAVGRLQKAVFLGYIFIIYACVCVYKSNLRIKCVLIVCVERTVGWKKGCERERY